MGSILASILGLNIGFIIEVQYWVQSGVKVGFNIGFDIGFNTVFNILILHILKVRKSWDKSKKCFIQQRQLSIMNSLSISHYAI